MAELRIFADFNSGGSPGAGPCWCRRYGKERKPLDDCANELDLTDGMEVILFYEDPGEEFEVKGRLIEPRAEHDSWQAIPDWATIRRIRG